MRTDACVDVSNNTKSYHGDYNLHYLVAGLEILSSHLFAYLPRMRLKRTGSGKNAGKHKGTLPTHASEEAT
jgi:hypothetical protein